MRHKKTIFSVPPSFLEVEQMAPYYAKVRGIPFSAFVWQAAEHYLREQLGEDELPDEVLMELDAIEEEMDRGEYVSLNDL